MFDSMFPEPVRLLFVNTGLIAWPLLLCSILSIAIIIERVVFLISAKSVPIGLQHTQVLESNRILYHLINELVSVKDMPKHLREEVMSISLSMARRQLFTGTGMLKFISTITPMLGLLGNVVGMIHSFTAISVSKSGINPIVISGGLQEAMYTTAIGIGIAIPSMFAEYIFSYIANSRIDNYFAYINKLNIDIESGLI